MQKWTCAVQNTHTYTHLCSHTRSIFASTFCFADVLRYMTLAIYTDILSRHRGVLWIGSLQV